MPEGKKQDQKNSFDVEISGKAKMKVLHVKKAGKVDVSSYSNIQYQETYEGKRVNMPDDIKDGETYMDSEIQTFKGVRIDEDDNSASGTY